MGALTTWTVTCKFEENKEAEEKETSQVDNNYYTLDAAVLRNTTKHHFSCYITCNNQQYSFDGLAKDKRMVPFRWKDNLNKDINWKLSKKKDNIVFNFKKGYTILIYYMTKKKELTRKKTQLSRISEEKESKKTQLSRISEEKESIESNTTTPMTSLKQTTTVKKTIFIIFDSDGQKYKQKFILLPNTKIEKVFEIFKKNLNLESSRFRFSSDNNDDISKDETIETLDLENNDIIKAVLL